MTGVKVTCPASVTYPCFETGGASLMRARLRLYVSAVMATAPTSHYSRSAATPSFHGSNDAHLPLTAWVLTRSTDIGSDESDCLQDCLDLMAAVDKAYDFRPADLNSTAKV